jgi:Spy/CpxP family protein refolding chaperone
MDFKVAMQMVRISLRAVLFFAFGLYACAVPLTAQEQQEQNNTAEVQQQQQQQGVAQSGDSINLVQELNLTPDQQAQIRALKEEHDLPIREALRRRNRAQRSLQEAIYADNADEATIGARSRELSEAQADLARLRTTVELRIRRILTPEQLQRFREIRQQRWQRAGQALRQNRQLQRQINNLPPPAAAQPNTQSIQQRDRAAQNQQMRREMRQQMRAERRVERQANRPPRPNRPVRPAAKP